MKYSQAVLVACIGSAALVSALPTTQPKDVTTVPVAAKQTSSAQHHSMTQPSKEHKEHREHKHANYKHADTRVNDNAKQDPSPTAPSPSKKVTQKSKPSALAAEATHQSAAPPTPKESEKHREHTELESKTKQHVASHHGPTSPAEPRGLFTMGLGAGIAHNILRKNRKKKAQEKAQQQAQWNQQNQAGVNPAPMGVQPQFPPVSPVMATRDLEDLLEERFISEKFLQRYRDAKNQRLQNQAIKAKNAAQAYSEKTGITPPNSPLARDFDDEDLYARHITVDEPIEARGISDFWNALWHKKQKPVTPTTPMTPTTPTSFGRPAARDLEEELEMRDFEDEELIARDYFDELDTRDYLEFDELD